MKIIIDPKEDAKEDVQRIIDFWYGKNQQGQQRIVPVCEDCGEQLTEKEVNYCAIKFPDQYLCKECQPKEGA